MNCKRCSAEGFTIIELMAATAILGIILLVVFSITHQVSSAWKMTSAKIEAYQEARAGFMTITDQLSQATLNTYYTCSYSGGAPSAFKRASDMHFVSGKSLVSVDKNTNPTHAVFFQAPIGYTDAANLNSVGEPKYDSLRQLMNACGYFIEYGPDPSRPAFLSNNSLPNQPALRYRYRLLQLLQPAEKLGVYDPASTTQDWFATPLASGSSSVRVAAENIVALIILPRMSAAEDSNPASLTGDYEYDTRDVSSAKTLNQLPPVVEVIMVAMDEKSALRLGNAATPPNLVESTWFNQAAQLEGDLDLLRQRLEGRRLDYRVFRSVVALRGAKWSSS